MNRVFKVIFAVFFALTLYAASYAQIGPAPGGGGGAPGGSTTQLQYNNSGVFAGTSGLTWNGSVLLVPAGDCAAPGLHGATATTGISIGGITAGAVSLCGAGSEQVRIANGGISFFSPTTINGTFQPLAWVQIAQTSNASLSTGNSGFHYNNLGASGEVDLTLPALGGAGTWYQFTVGAAQTFKIIANTGQTISIGTTTSASAGNITANGKYSNIILESISTTEWVATSSTGAWTVN